MEEFKLVLGQELISFCIPAMNRTSDLRRTLPLSIEAAKASPPVEIAVLDYNSSDGLAMFLWPFDGAVRYNRYEERDTYHMAHAYNLAVKCSAGVYVVVMGADAVLAQGYVPALRELIAEGCVWMRPRRCKGIVCVQRAEFMVAGGYDERLWGYMGEDKEFEARLRRRGGKMGVVPDGLVSVIRTPPKAKLANYGSTMTKREMMQMGARIRKENARAGLLVANEGRDWGSSVTEWAYSENQE
jgi:hypothetical protein